MEGKRNRQMGFGDDLLAGRMSADHWLVKLERGVDWSAFELPLGSLYNHTAPRRIRHGRYSRCCCWNTDATCRMPKSKPRRACASTFCVFLA